MTDLRLACPFYGAELRAHSGAWRATLSRIARAGTVVSRKIGISSSRPVNTAKVHCTVSLCRGVYPPNGNDANFPLPFLPPLSPFPPLPFPCPFPSRTSLPFPLLPGGLGAEPPVAGVRGWPPKKGNWNRIWWLLAHFCFRTAAIQCFTFYVWPIYLGEFFPLQGVILFPLSPIWTQVASTSPCRRPWVCELAEIAQQ